jgi:transcription elongation factor Elf1
MQERARRDSQQMVLKNSGIDKNPSLYTVVESSMAINPKKKVTCPFCLGLEEFRKFLVSTKKGISTGTAKCPLCGVTFRMKSLVGMAKWTAEEYAKWVYNYSKEGFWSKVNFNTWKGRLKLMGWTNDFWDAYNILKGEDMDESEPYTDYLDRVQREEAAEKGWTDQQEAAAAQEA